MTVKYFNLMQKDGLRNVQKGKDACFYMIEITTCPIIHCELYPEDL